MKKAMLTFSLVFVLLTSSVTTAYAGYSKLSGLTPGSAGYTLAQLLFNQTGNIVVDVGPNAANFTYKVTIGLGSLSDICTTANGIGLTCSLYYNSTQGLYVIRVHDRTTLGLTGTYGVIANSDGYVYTAPKDDTGNTTVNNTYNYNHTVINPSSPSSTRTPTSSTAPSYWEALDTLKAIYSKVDFGVQYLSLVCDWLNFQSKLLIDVVHSLERSVAPALEAVNNNLISTVKNLNAIYDILEYSYSVSLSQLDVENRIYSGVAGIGSRLDSIITNGEVQINTTPLEARLDKLISMYSKVNAVVLDTAAINGSQINDAVGGELEDVMFWGSSLKSGGQFVYADPLTYTLNGVQTTVVNVPLRGMVLGTSIPSTIDDTDEVLMAGVWQGSNGKYYVSDTYNAVTGEYVQRLRSITYDGSEGWKMTAKSDGMNMFWYRDKSIEDVSGGRDAMASASWLGYKNYDSTFYNQANAAAASKNKFTLAGQAFRIVVSADDYPDVASWTSYLSANPLTFFYVLSAPTDSGAAVDLPVVTMLDPVAIAIPEGDSTISAFRARITGKYETYDSYTQTADIIAAINNIPSYDDSGIVDAITNLETTLSKPSATVTADLTEVTTRLDTLIENSASKVENVTVNITEDNDAFNVFYITGDDGETQPITEFAKDLSGASGKFLSVLYRLVFSDALDSADSDLGNLEDFFASTEPVEDTATQSADSTHEEVDIWSAF